MNKKVLEVTRRGVVSRDRFRGLYQNAAVLSIGGVDEKRLPNLLTARQARRHLRLTFDDIETPLDGTPATPGQIREIAHWLRAQVTDPAIDRVVVHCEAGISRSVAVGLWARERLEVDLRLPPQAGRGENANRHVLGLLAHH